MTAEITDVQAIVTDLDNTLFKMPSEEIEQKLYALAAQKALQGHRLSLEFNTVLEMTLNSYRTRGHEMEVFTDAPYHLPRESLRQKFYECAVREFADALQPSADLQAALKEMPIDNIVVLTNSPAVWANDVILEKLALKGFINPENIIASDAPEIGGTTKKASPIPFQVAQKHLGIAFNKLLMIDDKDANLKHAKALGMKTALIHWGNAPVTAPLWADYQAPTVAALLRQIKK